MKNILFAASECVPFIKTGGLADVVGALPKNLNPKEYDVRVILPNYTCIHGNCAANFNMSPIFTWITVSIHKICTLAL